MGQGKKWCGQGIGGKEVIATALSCLDFKKKKIKFSMLEFITVCRFYNQKIFLGREQCSSAPQSTLLQFSGLPLMKVCIHPCKGPVFCTQTCI
jgi:hypothetical protein